MKKGISIMVLGLLLVLGGCGNKAASKSNQSQTSSSTSQSRTIKPAVKYSQKLRIAASSADADRIWFQVYSTSKQPITRKSRVVSIYIIGQNKMQQDFVADVEDNPKSGIPLSQFSGLSNVQIEAKVKKILAQHAENAGPRQEFSAFARRTDDNKGLAYISIGQDSTGNDYDRVAKPVKIDDQYYSGYYTFYDSAGDGVNKSNGLITAVDQNTTVAFDKLKTKGLTTGPMLR